MSDLYDVNNTRIKCFNQSINSTVLKTFHKGLMLLFKTRHQRILIHFLRYHKHLGEYEFNPGYV